MKTVTLSISLLLTALLCGCGASGTQQNTAGTTNNSEPNLTSTAAPTPTNLPYTVALTNPVVVPGLDSLQSFAFGTAGNYWVMIGGRTRGFHGTGGPGMTFPHQFSNKKIVVYDAVNKKRYAAAIPAQFYPQFSSTNMEFYNDKGTLWLAGGYGCSDNSNKPSCYQTYPWLTAVNLNKLITGVMRQDNAIIASSICTLRDSRFQVTGGSLKKLGNNFYLVMGHRYDSIYKDGVTGVYTEQIRRFNLATNGSTIAVSNYTAWSDPQFHRRDLNVVEALRPNGAAGINVFAGVFQPNARLGLPWTNPVLIDQNSNNITTVSVNKSFNQNFNAYECGNVLMYDRNTGTMYTSLIGGITSQVLTASGQPTNDPAAGFLPFSKYISTVAQYRNGVTTEYPQANPLLPGYIGGNAVIVLSAGTPVCPGTTEVIDYARLKSGDNLVGWMYGGINSTAMQTNAVSYPSFASATIYEVHIRK